MKKSWVIAAVVILAFIIFFYPFFTGYISSSPSIGYGGPSAEDITCMKSCASIGCADGDRDCMVVNGEACRKKCNVAEHPESSGEDESCMQNCVSSGCDEYDFDCERNNVKKCEDECNMKKDAPNESEMGAEELCIFKCVSAEDPTMICGNSREGETGGSLCQKCAQECVSLYEGPCLNDEKFKEKQNECQTCEHCYGELVEGPSGEGWDCIIDIKCMDASSEFGDNPGEGPGVGQEGFVEKVRDFFKGLFNKE